jgi:cytochrome c oxidase subunit 3
MADAAHAGEHAHPGSHGGGHGTPGHPYYLVDPSPWPFVGSMSALALTAGAVMWFHGSSLGGVLMLGGFVAVLYTMFVWFRDVIRESVRGDYSEKVASMLRIGMLLFIASEVLFFFGFFWAFFWGALVPPDLVHTTWPPEGVHALPTWQIPFLNTLILLLSGCTITWAHHALREGDKATTFKALAITVTLGVIFLGFQVYEYVELVHEGLTIDRGIFGSTFYMATGFHGFHVLVGTTFLIVCTMRAWYGTLRPERHVGFEAAAWYWHFVDVVWLFLFVSVYWWGGNLHWVSEAVQ